MTGKEQHAVEAAKTVGDVFSVGTVLGALAGLLPAIAAGFTIVWTYYRIRESQLRIRLLNKDLNVQELAEAEREIRNARRKGDMVSFKSVAEKVDKDK